MLLVYCLAAHDASPTLRSRSGVLNAYPREAALYPVFMIVQRLGQNWRALNGGENLMTLVLGGRVFQEGVRQRQPASDLAL